MLISNSIIGITRAPPKAEVEGSNPFGSAKHFRQFPAIFGPSKLTERDENSPSKTGTRDTWWTPGCRGVLELRAGADRVKPSSAGFMLRPGSGRAPRPGPRRGGQA